MKSRVKTTISGLKHLMDENNEGKKMKSVKVPLSCAVMLVDGIWRGGGVKTEKGDEHDL